MTDFTTIKVVESSFDMEQVQLQNLALRKDNGILKIISLLVIVSAVACYYRAQELEKNRLL